ncbi:probable xyloglucan galactosyltransferase GT19 [Physcomitrium patens]|uniref:Exostosin GT47 domain-containing protein n=1 Tax=Physcomitrium patens TaxID=3218 RepID=A0A2K1KPW1_PHYPA|nr:probable xyloglucan galactosyltransferase GT19 [Physcomitrium patens]PNR55833.1 hypothetical protein PHYPA_006730 [Physcomitrium patens]|eukprot:XP_024374807.1 probable xyloglucan galactosyltransferase GT19 [Physcomitrella patens]
MDFSKTAKKHRAQSVSKRRSISKVSIVVFIILFTTWFCPSPDSIFQQEETSIQSVQDVGHSSDACYGRRVHMYDMPEVFNTKILEFCDGKLVHWIHFCNHYKNYGFGEIVNTTNSMFRDDWYGTDAYMLEVIIFERMRSYPCLADKPANADIFYIPFFAGLDALPYLYNDTRKMDKQGHEVISWLRANAAESWARYGGQDHFMIAGRTAFDFGIPTMDDWGTCLLDLEEMQNVTFMVLERRPWRSLEQAIPYPVGFHPSNAASLNSWIERVRKSARTHLFSFTGALRPTLSIRRMLSNECENAATECSRLDCAKVSCSHNPVPIYESLLRANFCLQPRGDTATRRSTIDSIVSGCIPVLFHEDSAQKQYMWHFPEDYRTFSVFIHEDCVTNGTCIVRDILKKIKPAEVIKMREKLISMIPNVLYRNPSDVNFPYIDAFDLTIEGMVRKATSLKKSPPLSTS